MMMKKSLISSAIASVLLASSAAHAAKVYDQDGTSLDLYGRIAMGVESGGNAEDNGSEFVNVGSRLQLTGSSVINDDLRGFARVQWRFNGDERDQSSGFSEVRNSYLGVESATFGTLIAGNYDSFYSDLVAAPFDVYINKGFEIGGGGLQARGDSLGYITPNLEGFKAFISAKHYSSNDAAPGESSEIVTQGGVSYETGPFGIALGYVDDKDGVAGGAGEVLYGATASFAFNDAFSARIGYETQDDNFDTIGLGGTFSTGQWRFHADYYNKDEEAQSGSRDIWVAAAHYRLSSSLDFFVEFMDEEARDGDANDDAYYILGARYHF